MKRMVNHLMIGNKLSKSKDDEKLQREIVSRTQSSLPHHVWEDISGHYLIFKIVLVQCQAYIELNRLVSKLKNFIVTKHKYHETG